MQLRADPRPRLAWPDAYSYMSDQNLIDVAFSPDGECVANTDTSGDTYIWNMRWLG